MKKISEDQIKSVIDTFFQINAPVQIYAGVQKMLATLPDCKEEKDVQGVKKEDK